MANPNSVAESVADFLSRKLHIPWAAAVTLVYVVAVLVLLGLLTVGGVGLVQQVQNLIGLIQNSIKNLPTLLQDISGRGYGIRPPD